MALLLVVGTYNVAFLSCELTRTTRPVTEIESCRVGASRAGAGQTLVVWWNPCRAGQTGAARAQDAMTHDIHLEIPNVKRRRV